HLRVIQLIFYLDDRPAWVQRPKVNDRVHFDRDVVFGDDILRRHIHGDSTKTHTNDAIDRPEYPDKARSFCLRKKPPNAEDDAALVLAQDVQRVEYPDRNDGRGNDEQCELIHWNPFMLSWREDQPWPC